MARLTDPEILARYKQALADWKIAGAVELDKDAHTGLRKTLPGVTVASFKEALYRFVCLDNGEIVHKKEDRDSYPCNLWENLYKLHLSITGVEVFVETRLGPESFTSRDDPQILVVKVKPEDQRW